MIREVVSEHFRERYRTMRLDSGFEITHYYKPFSLQAAFLSVDYGSMHREYLSSSGERVSHPMGSAHFLEHKLFETYPEDVMKQMAKWGVSVNAYTSHDRTCFYFFGGTHFEKALRLLLELPVRPGFTEEGVEREKPVITREIELYEDDVESFAYRQALEALFPEHPVSEEILGTRSSVQEVTSSSLQQILRDCYTPSRMQLLLIGSFDEGILERVAQMLPRAYHEKREDVLTQIQEASTFSPGRLSFHKDISLPAFTYLQRLPQLLDPKKRAESLLQWEMILESLTGAGSSLYTDQYAKGTLFSLHAYTVNLPGACFFGISGEGRNPDAFFDAMQKEFFNVREQGMNPADIQRIKKRKIGERLRVFDQYSDLSFHFLDQRRTGVPLFEEAELLFNLPDEVGCLPEGEWVYSVVSKESI